MCRSPNVKDGRALLSVPRLLWDASIPDAIGTFSHDAVVISPIRLYYFTMSDLRYLLFHDRLPTISTISPWIIYDIYYFMMGDLRYLLFHDRLPMISTSSRYATYDIYYFTIGNL